MPVRHHVEGQIGYVTFDRPERMNALDYEMRKEFVRAMATVGSDESARVVILTGVGKAFCTGHDIKERQAGLLPGQYPDDPATFGLYEAVLNLDKPVIAAINGTCLAQGAGLAMLADILIAADDVQFGWPHVTKGMFSAGGTVMLPRAIPRNIAFEYLLTGEFFPAARALELGLINRVAPKDEVVTQAEELARRILRNSPNAIRMMLQVAQATADSPMTQSLQIAEMMLDSITDSDDAKEGLAAFVEKRDPIWTGR